MYDGATAMVEALLMAIRATKRKTVILAKTIHPEYRKTAQTYLPLADFSVVEADFNETGETNLSQLAQKIEDEKDLAAVAIQSPNFFGRIEEVASVAKLAHARGALLVAVTTDVSANAILQSHGRNNADIAVGEGLSHLLAVLISAVRESVYLLVTHL